MENSKLRSHLLAKLGTRVPKPRQRGRIADLYWIERHVVLDYEERALVRYAIKEAQAMSFSVEKDFYEALHDSH